MGQLEGTGPEDRPDGGVQAIEPPALGEPAGDAGIDLALVVDDAPHQLGEERFICGGKGLALLRADRTVEPVLGELPDYRLHPDPGDFHLVEGLDRRQAGDGPRRMRRSLHLS